MATCAHCGSAYVPGALYCDTCGHPLPSLETWTPGSEPVPQEPDAPEVTEEPTEEPETLELDEEPTEELTETQPEMQPETQAETQPHLWLQLPSGMTIDLGDRSRIQVGRKDAGKRPDVDLAPYGGIENGVSRQHAVITFDNGRYYIEDLYSVNETLLNSYRLFPGQPYPLKHGDQLQFGALVVTVLLRDAAQ